MRDLSVECIKLNNVKVGDISLPVNLQSSSIVPLDCLDRVIGSRIVLLLGALDDLQYAADVAIFGRQQLPQHAAIVREPHRHQLVQRFLQAHF